MGKHREPIKGVYQKKSYWYARVDGKEVYCGKGAKGQKTAEIRRKKYEVECHENREALSGLEVKKTELKTVNQLIDWYLDLHSIKSLKSYTRKVQACNHLKSFFGKYLVSGVEGDLQEEYRELRLNQSATHTTIDLEIQNLSAVYHLALKRKKIDVHAMPGQFTQRKENNPRRIITDDEFNKILKKAKPDFTEVLICAYESAMRSGEIASLTPAQVHLDELHISGQKLDYIYLGVFDTKTGAERVVPVSPALKEILKHRMKRLKAEDYIFSRNGFKYTDDSISLRMKNTCKRAKVPYGDRIFNKKGERAGVVFHCLRHTRISKWVEMGYSDEIIRRASGHKSLEAFRRYVKLDKNVVMGLVDQNQNATKPRQNLSKAL